jgi:hypothetical protein
MMIALPYPAKPLWPNGKGRSNWRAVHAEFKQHKEWARLATLATLPRCFQWNGQPIRLRYVLTPQLVAPDKDNFIAACKAYQDGIGIALKVDDKHFEAPLVEIVKPKRLGGVEVFLTYGETDG